MVFRLVSNARLCVLGRRYAPAWTAGKVFRPLIEKLGGHGVDVLETGGFPSAFSLPADNQGGVNQTLAIYFPIAES